MKLDDIGTAYAVDVLEFDSFESMRDKYRKEWTAQECQNWYDCLNNRTRTGFIVEYGVIPDDRPQYRTVRWHQPVRVWAVTGADLDENLLDQILAGQVYRVS